jgi:small GTP-binding protein
MTEHCGLVAIVGAPNAGKSTLVNALVGQKVAIVSAKAQTTRTRMMGVAIEGESQIILVDTPGIFAPRRRLDRAMVAAAWGGAQDADLIALVIDAKAGLKERIEPILDTLTERREPKIAILNKVDVTPKERLLELATLLNDRLKPEAIFMVISSAHSPSECPKAPGTSPRIRSPTPPIACSPPKSPASSFISSSMPSFPMRARSRPRNMRSAATAPSPSTSRSWSVGTRRRRSCSASAARD